jgi:hypothetical protein
VFRLCPLKQVIGDQAPAAQRPDSAPKPAGKRAAATSRKR